MWKSKAFVLFFGFVAAISLVFLYLAWRTTVRYDHLIRSGIRTQGEVVDHYTRTGNRGYSQNYYYVYRFSDSQAESHDGLIIRNAPDDRLAVGQNIEIIYSPLDPQKNMLSDMMPRDIYQPVYASLKYMLVALGVTLAFGKIVFSKVVLTNLSRLSLKRLFR